MNEYNCTNQAASCASSDKYFPKMSIVQNIRIAIKNTSELVTKLFDDKATLSSYFNYNDSSQTALKMWCQNFDKFMSCWHVWDWMSPFSNLLYFVIFYIWGVCFHRLKLSSNQSYQHCSFKVINAFSGH